MQKNQKLLTDEQSRSDHLGEQVSESAAAVTRWQRGIRVASAVLTLLSLLIAGRSLPMGRIAQRLEELVEALGVWGPFAFAAIYVGTTILMVPGSALTLVAGAIFGLVWGTIAVSIGSTLGVAATFLIGRYLARDSVEQKLRRSPKLRAVDRAVKEGGWKIVALLRLSPAIPFNLQNYLYGLTSIRFLPCVLASWIAMLPGTFMYVYLGYAGRASLAAATDADSERSLAEWVMLGVGLVATIVVTVYITRLAQRAISRQADEGAASSLLEAEEQEEQDAMAAAEQSPADRNVLVTIGYAVVAAAAIAAAVWISLRSEQVARWFV